MQIQNLQSGFVSFRKWVLQRFALAICFKVEEDKLRLAKIHLNFDCKSTATLLTEI